MTIFELLAMLMSIALVGFLGLLGMVAYALWSIRKEDWS